MSKKINTIIADTAAFIKNASLQDLAETVYTVQSVVDEVTSKRQLKNLVVLPYQLKIKDPWPENIKFITDFSKKTGDYPSLSATDIQVLALTYELEKQLVGNEHLKREPTIKRTSTVGKKCGVQQIAGFYMPKKDASERIGQLNSEVLNLEVNTDLEEEPINTLERTNILVDEPLKSQMPFVEEPKPILEEKSLDEVDVLTEADIEYLEEESEEDVVEADIGWITPQNIAAIKKQMKGCEDITENPPTVACITSDFAMQNVLRQIGLEVISADGKLIRHVRTYILRCYACFKTTSIMTKVFCPKCGNRTLKRVAVTLNENGSLKMHFSRKPLTARGKQQSLPMPKSGKHANNDIRFEDQPIPQQRPTRLARTKNNPLDPDYIAGFSPFVTRDTNSRAAMLGINSNWSTRGQDKSGYNKRGTYKRK